MWRGIKKCRTISITCNAIFIPRFSTISEKALSQKLKLPISVPTPLCITLFIVVCEALNTVFKTQMTIVKIDNPNLPK